MELSLFDFLMLTMGSENLRFLASICKDDRQCFFLYIIALVVLNA